MLRLGPRPRKIKRVPPRIAPLGDAPAWPRSHNPRGTGRSGGHLSRRRCRIRRTRLV